MLLMPHRLLNIMITIFVVPINNQRWNTKIQAPPPPVAHNYTVMSKKFYTVSYTVSFITNSHQYSQICTSLEIKADQSVVAALNQQ